MTTKFFVTTAFAAIVAFSSVPAMANDVFINQFGFGHAAGGQQIGNDNQIGVFQDGAVQRNGQPAVWQ